MSKPLRVVQWATGNTGCRALREVIRHPRLELAGVLTYSNEKAGKDAGEICGEAPTGVRLTTSRDEIFALKADCVLYMPRASGPAAARSGLTIEQVLDDVCTLLDGGTNVVTTVTDFHAGGHPRLGERGLARIRAACGKSGASLYATGTDPGYVLEQIAYAFLASQRRVDAIEVIEYGDVSAASFAGHDFRPDGLRQAARSVSVRMDGRITCSPNTAARSPAWHRRQVSRSMGPQRVAKWPARKRM